MRYELTIDFGPEDPDNTKLSQRNATEALFGAVIDTLHHLGYFHILEAVTEREVPS